MKRKIFTAALAVCAACCFCLAAACAGSEKEIERAESPYIYRVGDTVDCFDLIRAETGVEYTFSASDPQGGAVNLADRTFYVASAGTYTVTVRAQDRKDAVIQVPAYERAPYMVQGQEVILYRLGITRPLNMIINSMSKWIPSYVGNYEEYLSRVEIDFYQTDENDAVEIDLTGEGDGEFFDGRRFTFAEEGLYTFTLVVENGGGAVEGTIVISVLEDFSDYTDLQGYSAEYDRTSHLLTWDAVPGAERYKIKIDRKTAYTAGAETSINISEYLAEWQYFDLYIIPLNAAGDPLTVSAGGEDVPCRITIEGLVISPEQYPGVVLSAGASIDEDTGKATLTGGVIDGSCRPSYIDNLDNSYVAFKGEYGFNTYVDFYFTGNNMPQVLFFSNDISGNMTNTGGGRGLLVMNGLMTSSEMIGGNNLVAFAPERLSENYNDNGAARVLTLTEAAGFGEFGQNNLVAGKNYRYTLGTYEEEGLVVLDVSLYERTGSGEKIIYSVQRGLSKNMPVTDENGAQQYDENGNRLYQSVPLLASELEPGNIVAYAGVKGRGYDTVFTFGMPYDAGDRTESGVTHNADGSVTLAGAATIPNPSKAQIAAVKHSFYAFEGSYGINTFADFYFTGNNMPQVMLYADSLSGNLTNTRGGKGILIMNGMVHGDNSDMDSSGNPQTYDKNVLRIFGPERISKNYDGTTPGSTVSGTQYDTVFSSTAYPEMTMAGLSPEKNYKYTVGSVPDNNERYIQIIIKFYEQTAGGEYSLIYDLQIPTNIEMTALESGSIIAYAGIKGEGLATTFSFREPYVDQAAASPVKTYRARTDGTGVTLFAAEFVPTVATKAHIAQADSAYLAFKGDYGAGYYVEFEFTGNNMPQVMFFANEINGNMTNQVPSSSPAVNNENKGLLVTNGLKLAGGTVNGGSALRIWGPDRISRHYDGSGETLGSGWIASLTAYPEFTQNGLIEDRNYRYSAGTYIENGEIVLDLKLYYESDGDYILLYDVQVKTGLAEADMTGTNIVAYAGLKGAGDDTVFSYTLPAIKEN